MTHFVAQIIARLPRPPKSLFFRTGMRGRIEISTTPLIKGAWFPSKKAPCFDTGAGFTTSLQQAE